MLLLAIRVLVVTVILSISNLALLRLGAEPTKEEVLVAMNARFHT